VKILRCFIQIFINWTLIGVAGKVVFLGMYYSLIPDLTLNNGFLVLWYGLRLDLSIAGYITIIPGILLLIGLWYKGKYLRWVWEGYFLLNSKPLNCCQMGNRYIHF